jgi:DNA-3-methyladenine glycosylase II
MNMDSTWSVPVPPPADAAEIKEPVGDPVGNPVSDPVLARLMSTLLLPPLPSTRNVFHDLMSCIIEQQIHYRSTKRIFPKLLEAAGLTELTPQTFELFESDALARLKMAAGKSETMLRTLEFFQENHIDWKALPDEQVRRQLSAIKGVGTWSIDMVLLYTLQRPDVFPLDDFHLKQVMVSLYGLNPNTRLRAQMQEVGSRWGNQKSRAVRYLLAWKEATKKIKKP